MKNLSHILHRHQAAALVCSLVLPLILGLAACNEDRDTQYNGAELTYFGFDSFPAFADYKFYVDNVSHRIYNLDSFPYRSKVDSMFPRLTAVTSSKILIDDQEWNGKSCLDWSHSPVSLVNVSSDKKYTASYQVYVNVHQLDPDSMQVKAVSHGYPAGEGRQTVLRTADGWLSFFAQTDGSVKAWSSADARTWTAQTDPTGLSGQLLVETLCALRDTFYLANAAGTLFSSADALTWTTVAGTEKVLALFGPMGGRKYLTNDALIGMVAGDDGKPCFARFEGSWTKGDTVPDSFPREGFALAQSQTVTGVAFSLLTGGLTAAGDYATGLWSTMDGLYWARLAEPADEICQRNEAAIFYYDDRLYLWGGERDGATDTKLYVSDNHGLAWEAAPDKQQFQAITEGIYGHRILVEDDYIRIFGGKSGTATATVWEAYLNQALF
ncbi:MAG: hypothetical protein IJR64_05175 [Bacteroidales bacterium]|nr:hypothetical protein [Bacteroidales bacterium]